MEFFFLIIYTYGKNPNGIRIKKTGKQFKRKMSFHCKGLSVAAYVSNVPHRCCQRAVVFKFYTTNVESFIKDLRVISSRKNKIPTPDKRLKSTFSETVEIPFNYQDRKFKTSLSKRMESQYFISFSSRDVSRGALVKRQAEL